MWNNILRLNDGIVWASATSQVQFDCLNGFIDNFVLYRFVAFTVLWQQIVVSRWIICQLFIVVLHKHFIILLRKFILIRLRMLNHQFKWLRSWKWYLTTRVWDFAHLLDFRMVLLEHLFVQKTIRRFVFARSAWKVWFQRMPLTCQIRSARLIHHFGTTERLLNNSNTYVLDASLFILELCWSSLLVLLFFHFTKIYFCSAILLNFIF